MKKWLFVLLMAGHLLPCAAQNPDHKNAFAARALFIDYNTLNNQQILEIQELTNGFELTYYRNLSSRVSIAMPLKGGLLRYMGDLNNTTFLGLDGVFQVGLFDDFRTVVPYLMAGAGIVSTEFNSIDLQAPVGAGVNFKLYKGVFVSLEGQARFSIKDDRNSLHFGAGFLIQPGKYDNELPVREPAGVRDSDNDGVTDDKDACINIPGSIAAFGCPDNDEDGIANDRDDCPDVKGIAAFQGCPDTDGDGLMDKEDNCPTDYGTKENQGCPDIDADKDGVFDRMDDCPFVAGSAKTKGCPDRDDDAVADRDDDCPDIPGLKEFRGCPDTDGDGLPDKDDACPTSAGPKENNGCPVIEKEDKEILNTAMRAIQFEFGKSSLKAESYPVLDQVSRILQKYPDYRVSIEGHTDNVGSNESNLELSRERAKSCYDYLVFKGISADRMSYTGFGESKPVETNNTDEGRYQNRRVEFNLILN